MDGSSLRLHKPQAVRQIVSRAQSQTKPSRVTRQLEEMVGRKTTSKRWMSIKQKYNVKEKGVNCVPTEVILKINMKERMKSQAELVRRERIRTELVQRLSTPKNSPPNFFNFSKRNISYIESHQQSPKQSSTPKKMESRSSFWQFDDRSVKRHRRRFHTDHPIMEMYKSTSDNVVRSVRANKMYDGPFDWFASFDELHPY